MWVRTDAACKSVPRNKLMMSRAAWWVSGRFSHMMQRAGEKPKSVSLMRLMSRRRCFWSRARCGSSASPAPLPGTKVGALLLDRKAAGANALDVAENVPRTLLDGSCGKCGGCVGSDAVRCSGLGSPSRRMATLPPTAGPTTAR